MEIIISTKSNIKEKIAIAKILIESCIQENGNRTISFCLSLALNSLKEAEKDL